MIRIIIVDDHSIIRTGIKRILAEEKDMEVVGEASNYSEALNLIEKSSPDIVLLDISLPGRDGLDVLKDIKIINKKVKVLIMSMHPEDRLAVRAIKLGACGYLTKESTFDELVNAIHKINDGSKFISQVLAEKLVTAMADKTEILPHENLSTREFQILCLIAAGKRIKSIAEELTLSSHTINSFRQRIFKKLHLKTNVELTGYALRNNLID